MGRHSSVHNEPKQFCILCRSSYGDLERGKSVKCIEKQLTLSKFYKGVLLSSDSRSCGEAGGAKRDLYRDTSSSRGRKRRKVSASSKAFLGGDPLSFSSVCEVPEVFHVCPDCLVLIQNATDWEEKVVEIENRVRWLQSQVLAEMKELQRRVGKFYVEMRRIQGVVKGSKSSMERSDVGGLEAVRILRESILCVAKGLEAYDNQVTSKFFNRSRKTEHNDYVQNAENTNTSVGDMDDNDNDAFLNGVNMDNLIKVEDEAFGIEAIESPAFLPDHFASGPSHTPMSSEGDSHSEAEDNPGDDTASEKESTASEEAYHEDLKNKNERKSRIIGDEKMESTKTPRKRKYPRLVDDKDLEGLSGWRRKVVFRVLRRKRGKRREIRALDSNDDPHEKYSMEYDRKTGCLCVGEITDLLINDQDESLSCSKCDFRSTDPRKRGDPADLLLYNHVLGQHLNAFVCQVCKKHFVQWTHYNLHLRTHKDPEVVTCDICGNRMSSRAALRRHQWTHMTDEEKAESIRAGKMKVCWDKSNYKYQCSICAKSFSNSAGLDSHKESVHPDNANIFICPRCGKDFSHGGYNYHIRYVCREQDDGKLIQCDLCPGISPKKRNYRNTYMLRRHKMKMHSEPGSKKDTEEICEVCGKKFKRKVNLAKHIVEEHEAVTEEGLT